MTERPDVPGPMPHWPDGGNWEGGTTDTTGQRWTHVSNQGWERRSRSPFFRESRRERRKRLGLHWWQLGRAKPSRPIRPGMVDLQEESGNTQRGGDTS